MAVLMNKENERSSDLSRRISAGLREKMAGVSEIGDTDPDFAEDAEYIQDFKKTSRFGWVWIVLIVVAVVMVVAASVV